MPAAVPASKAAERHSNSNTNSNSDPDSSLDLKSKLPSKEQIKDEISSELSEAKSAASSQLRNLIAGGAGGICAVVVGHPFDLVKVRMQTAERGVYSSAIDVVRKTVAREGLARGLYAGVSAPLVGVTPMFMVSFWGYGVGKSLVESFSTVPMKDKVPQYSISQISTAGFLSALPMTLITAPFERVKVLLQLQGQQKLEPGQKPRYSGGLDVVRQLYREGGLRSVFRGSAMTLARDGPGSAAYFATYESVKRALTPQITEEERRQHKEQKLSLTAILVAGGAAGVAMWIPVFPVDTVKSRLQSAAAGSKNMTISATVADLYRNRGGIRAFFPGFGPALARAVPANAATFLGVEVAHMGMKRLMGEGE